MLGCFLRQLEDILVVHADELGCSLCLVDGLGDGLAHVILPVLVGLFKDILVSIGIETAGIDGLIEILAIEIDVPHVDALLLLAILCEAAR